MKKNPVGWFEIYVDDMKRARTFYESVFEGKLEKMSGKNPEMWGFPGSMTGRGCGGALVKMKGFGAGGNSTLVYFRCADCAGSDVTIAAGNELNITSLELQEA